ncbi:MAG: heparinase II/III family protein [Acidobacteria bacterium]|nr:heparinase II/III family protein [Acidobacteriota bacterium]
MRRLFFILFFALLAVAGWSAVHRFSRVLAHVVERESEPVAEAAEEQAVPEDATYGLNIPRTHPRLWWTPERLARAESAPFKARDDDKISMAARCMIKHDRQACDAAVQWAMGLQVNTESVASDQARYFGESFILIFDWCHDSFSDEQRQILIQRWNDALTTLMRKEWGGPEMPQNNYFWGYLRNELEWGIATYHENPQASRFLHDALEVRWHKAFVAHAREQGLGGVPQEGAQYGRYQITYPIVGFASAALLGRDVYRESNYFPGSAYYVIYTTTPAPTTHIRQDAKTGYDVFPFDDDEMWFNGAAAEANYYGDFMTEVANEWAGTPLGSHARAWLKLVHPQVSNFIAAADGGGAAGDLSSLPLDYYSPGVEYFYGRSDWTGRATAFNLQLSRPNSAIVGHAHMDAGNWQIWRGGRWLSRETVGYGDQLAGYAGEGKVESSGTLPHNTLLVNGTGMALGWPVAPSNVRRLETRPEYSYVDVDLSGQYRYARRDSHVAERDNPAAAHVEREFVFVRPLETLVIFDRVQSAAFAGKTAAQVTKTFVAHFEESPQVSDESHVLAMDGNQALRLSTLLPAQHSYRVVPEGGKFGQYRLEVDGSGSANTYFLNVLQARDRSAADLQATLAETADEYVLTLLHPEKGKVTLTFRKGVSTPAGGSITVGGTTRKFLDREQKITVSEQGPAWEPLP